MATFTNSFGSSVVQQGTQLNQPPAILNDGNTVGWYDYRLSVAKDGSNAVSAWGDLSGSNHPLLQTVGAYQPAWSMDGVLFDGIDNFMDTTNFGLSQPTMIYLVAKFNDLSSLNIMIDGVGGRMLFTTFNNAPEILMYSGTLAYPLIIPDINYHVFRLSYNGLSSFYKQDAATASGLDVGSSNAGGILFGCDTAKVNFGNVTIKEAIFRDVVDSENNETAIYNYLKKKYAA